MLEERKLFAVMTPDFLLHQPVLSSNVFQPAASSAPTGLTPAVMRKAYGVDVVKFGSIVGDGSGQTIAIVDAYDLPTAESDLIAFSNQFGLPAPPVFKKINQTGGTTPPKPDVKGGWGVETALDIEWAHAIAPKANILLVEANSASDADLYTAVDTARNYPGVTAISMSWGADEASTDSANDKHFTTPAGHTPVAFVSSSGDAGAYSDTNSKTKIVSYPAVSPNVVAVGGTYLTTSSGTYVSETGWGSGTSSGLSGGSGGGISKYFAQPLYQKGTVTQSTTLRTIPDVAMDADPRSGAAVFDAYDNGPSTPWTSVGGTSLASPMFAGVVAIVDQGRALNGLSSLDGATELLPALYSASTLDFHDITSGNNGYAAAVGYDLVTGRGTPIVNQMALDLSAPPVAKPTIGAFVANPSSVVVDSPFSLTASNVVEKNGTISKVSFYQESNGVAGLQADADVLVGTGTQSGNTWTISVSSSNLAVGTYSFYAVATDANQVDSAVSTASLTVVNQTPPTNGVLLGWNVAGQTGFGRQGLVATSVAAGLTNSQGLLRGNGLSTTGTAAANAWGATGWSSTSATALTAGDVISFGFTVGVAQTASLSAIDLNYRHSSAGPVSGLWQYKLDSGAWINISDVKNAFPSTSSSGAAMTELSLSGVTALQNMPAGTQVLLRLVPYGGPATSTASSTWYIYDQSGDDLFIKGTLNGSTSTGGGNGPVFSSGVKAAIALVSTTAGPIANTSVIDFGRTIYTGALDVTNTLNRIRNDVRGISSNDGSVYSNFDRKLPAGTWYEFVVDPKTGSDRSFNTISFPGPMRLLISSTGLVYFTGDHYSTFQLVWKP